MEKDYKPIIKIILRDEADEMYDDLVTFSEYVNYYDVLNVVEEVKKREDYCNEDVYKALEENFGAIDIEWIGNYNIVLY